VVNKNVHAYVDYEVDTGREGLDTYTFSGGARIRF